MATLEFKLTGKDDDLVDLHDLSAFASKLQACLDRIHSAIGTQREAPRFMVHTAAIASFSSGIVGTAHAGICIDQFVKTCNALRDRTDLPLKLSSADIRNFKKLADPLDHHTGSILLNNELPIDSKFVSGCDWALSKASKSLGSVNGRLDGLNIHNAKFFRLYPEGVPRGAECYYSDTWHESVIRNIGKRVQVEGTIHWDPDMVGVDHVTDITSITTLKEDSELPSLTSLLGMFASSPVNIGTGWE